MNQVDTTRHTNHINSDYRCIYIIRHGECESNIQWPIPNYTDEADVLTSKGRLQVLYSAKLLGQIFSAWGRDITKAKLYSSTLTRAKETTSLMVEHLGLPQPVNYDERLIEFSGKHDDSESFRKRIREVFEVIEKIESDCIVVCHGHTMQAILALTLGIDFMKINTSVNNGGICIFHGRDLIHWNVVPLTDKGFGF